jgi:hypothetical protein
MKFCTCTFLTANLVLVAATASEDTTASITNNQIRDSSLSRKLADKQLSFDAATDLNEILFIADIFGTSPGSSTHAESATQYGMQSGGLRLGLFDEDGGSRAEGSVSAGYEMDFVVGTGSTAVEISFDFTTDFDACFGPEDQGQVLVAVDGGDLYRIQVIGFGSGYLDWQAGSAVYEGLTAGSHTLHFGALLEYGTGCGDGTNNKFEVKLDNLLIDDYFNAQ